MVPNTGDACCTTSATTPTTSATVPTTPSTVPTTPSTLLTTPAGPTTPAATASATTAATRRLTRPLLTAAPHATALAIGLRQDGRRVFVVRGSTAPDGTAEPVDTATRFETGSLTKTFTALLLAEQAARGELGLHDPVAAHLPAGTRMPPGAEHITLTHLATHTSGLPRLPPGLLRSAGSRLFANPYAAFDADAVLCALARTRLHARPGSRVRYSNFGAGLLGYALSAAAGGIPYADLLAARILEPLRLHDTDAADPLPDVFPQLTGAWHGRPRPPFRIPGLPAAGAVRSSVRDLLTVTDALITPDGLPAPLPATLRTALHDVTMPRLVRPHRSGAIALIWNIRPRPDGSSLHHHSGGTCGFTAFTGFNQRRRVALVALANAGPGWGNSLIQRAYEAVLRCGNAT